MTVTATAPPEATAGDGVAALSVAGIRNPGSYGVARYAARLAEALADESIRYHLEERATSTDRAHFHLANSSRAFLFQAPSRKSGCVVTVHDVVPRTRALVPLYRALVYPSLSRRAVVVVHSSFAADLLTNMAGRRPARLEVIPFPAQRPRVTDRSGARRALGWPEEALIAVVPGVIKSVKLAGEALAAVSSSPDWRLALAGRVVDREVAAAVRAQGGFVLADPSDEDYERALVASDCVLCLRSDTVGETNMPLLDALGAGRAVLATATGSIPEVARESALYCAATPDAIRDGLAALSDPGARAELERAAEERAAGLTWRGSAALHAALFREVFA